MSTNLDADPVASLPNIADWNPYSYLNEIEMQQIQMMAWDFFSAYKMGDKFRCGRIFQIIVDITKIRQELPTLQDYFRGRKIGRHKGKISIRKAAQYVAFVASTVRQLADPRIQSSPIE